VETYTLKFNDRLLLEQVISKLPASGFPYMTEEDTIIVRDTNGVRVRLI